MITNCTHIIVSLLKVWKVTVEGQSMTMPPFHIISEVFLLQESKDERRARLDYKYRERALSLFNEDHFPSYTTSS